MKRIYARTIFFNPVLLVCTVLYWYHSAEKGLYTLTLLTVLPIIIYFFDLSKDTQIISSKVKEVDRIGIGSLLLFVLLGRVQNKVVLIDITTLMMVLYIASICSALYLSMHFNLHLNASILLCFSLPFVIAIALNNTKHVIYYIKSCEGN